MIIKEKSINEFLGKWMIYNPEVGTQYMGNDGCNRIDTRPQLNVLSHTQILLKIECGLSVGDSVKFNAKDNLQYSRIEVNCVLIFIVEEYDDIAVKLTLKDKAISIA